MVSLMITQLFALLSAGWKIMIFWRDGHAAVSKHAKKKKDPHKDIGPREDGKVYRQHSTDFKHKYLFLRWPTRAEQK